MADRRRINGPLEGTTPPVFVSGSTHNSQPKRSPTTLRNIFLKTSLTPPATGSAFLELPSPSPSSPLPSSTLKLTASVYGPRPLPQNSPFSPNARVSAELKFAPFSAPGRRRGYVRDGIDRDLSAQLALALSKSVDVGKYPKSGIDIFVTVLDCEGGLGFGGDVEDGGVDVGLMGVLAGAISCASTAIADAGIECFDLVSGGVAALVMYRGDGGEEWQANGERAVEMEGNEERAVLVLDPSPADGYVVLAAAAVGYMAARDEVTLVWTKSSMGRSDGEGKLDGLIDGAIMAATEVRLILNQAVKERLLLVLKENAGQDMVMEEV